MFRCGSDLTKKRVGIETQVDGVECKTPPKRSSSQSGFAAPAKSSLRTPRKGLKHSQKNVDLDTPEAQTPPAPIKQKPGFKKGVAQVVKSTKQTKTAGVEKVKKVGAERKAKIEKSQRREGALGGRVEENKKGDVEEDVEMKDDVDVAQE